MEPFILMNIGNKVPLNIACQAIECYHLNIVMVQYQLYKIQERKDITPTWYDLTAAVVQLNDPKAY